MCMPINKSRVYPNARVYLSATYVRYPWYVRLQDQGTPAEGISPLLVRLWRHYKAVGRDTSELYHAEKKPESFEVERRRLRGRAPSIKHKLRLLNRVPLSHKCHEIDSIDSFSMKQ